MKTVFTFDDEVVTIKHKKSIKILREIREDNYEWCDQDNNIIKHKNHIVIRLNKNHSFNDKDLKWDYSKRISMGYKFIERDDFNELLFYDRETFTWILYDLERYGVFEKIVRRVRPNWDEYGELFPCYINPVGFWQWSYDILFGLIQLPFGLYKERKNERGLNNK